MGDLVGTARGIESQGVALFNPGGPFETALQAGKRPFGDNVELRIPGVPDTGYRTMTGMSNPFLGGLIELLGRAPRAFSGDPAGIPGSLEPIAGAFGSGAGGGGGAGRRGGGEDPNAPNAPPRGTPNPFGESGTPGDAGTPGNEGGPPDPFGGGSGVPSDATNPNDPNRGGEGGAPGSRGGGPTGTDPSGGGGGPAGAAAGDPAGGGGGPGEGFAGKVGETTQQLTTAAMIDRLLNARRRGGRG